MKKNFSFVFASSLALMALSNNAIAFNGDNCLQLANTTLSGKLVNRSYIGKYSPIPISIHINSVILDPNSNGTIYDLTGYLEFGTDKFPIVTSSSCDLPMDSGQWRLVIKAENSARGFQLGYLPTRDGLSFTFDWAYTYGPSSIQYYGNSLTKA